MIYYTCSLLHLQLFGRSEFLDHEVEASGPQSSSKVKKTYFEDYLTAGNVIGEMSLLSGKPRNCSAICETDVQVSFLGIKGTVSDEKNL